MVNILLGNLRYFIYLIWTNFKYESIVANSYINIDIIIPLIEKDLEILPLCLEGLKNNVSHRIQNIYIVAPNIESIIDFASKNNLIFIDENNVLGYSPKNINYITSNGRDRSGWVFQQLIKLSGRIGTSRYYLVIDSDHILLKPHTFITEDNLIVFYLSSEFHYPYYKMNYNLTNDFSVSLFSYVSHKMIFDKDELKKLHNKLETCNMNKLAWDEIILSSLDANEPSSFSEFELYGNYVDKSKKILRPWKQKTLKRNKLVSYENLKNIYSKYWSVTFPSYLNK
jgi:hypothetical protein